MNEDIPNKNNGSVQNINSGLRRRVIHGTSWNIFHLFVSSGFKYLVQLILAYLLVPKVFGLIGMSAVFISIVDTINDLGLGSALIQKKNDHLDEVHYSTVFWITLGFACFTFILMVTLISPIVSAFYGEPILRLVLIVLSIPILLRPLTLIQRIKLTREINFKPIALIESLGAIVGGVAAIIMASLGFGVWSIALQGTFASMAIIPSLWKVVPWRPQKLFSRKAFNDTFNYGVFVMFKSVCTTFMDNVDYLMIGKMLGSYYVGVYTFAFLLTDILRKQIMGIMGRVMFPVYAKVQDQPEVVGLYYLKVIRYNTMLIIPLMMGMVVFAEPINNIIFNGKWFDSVIPIQLLSFAVMFHVGTGTFSTVLLGIGRAKDDFFIFSLKNFLLYLPLLFFFIKYWGVIGAASAVLIYKSISFLINLILTRYYLRIRQSDILKNIIPSIISSAAVFLLYNILELSFGQPDSYFQLVFYIFAITLIYIISVFPFTKSEIKLIKNWINGRKNNRGARHE